MFAQILATIKKEKRVKAQRIDVVAEQVKKVLQDTDQQLILMVRG